MIDIHSHIIPAIDDGSKNIYETISLIKEAKKNGIDKIYATPHYFPNRYLRTRYEIEEYVTILNKMLKEEKIDVEILTGQEIKITNETINNLRDSTFSSLNNGIYLLIEFDLNTQLLNECEYIADILEAGYIPVIAHPERYKYINKDYKKAIEYVRAGAVLQMDIASISGIYGKQVKKTIKKLLKHNLIHLWGSNVHYADNNEYLNLKKHLSKFKKIVGKKNYNNIAIINSEKLYNNIEIDTSSYNKKWYSFKSK